VFDLKTVEDWKKMVIGNKTPIVLDCYAEYFYKNIHLIIQ